MNIKNIFDAFNSENFQNDDETYKHGLLSQWRGYGNDGGYAIEFNKKKLIMNLYSSRPLRFRKYDE